MLVEQQGLEHRSQLQRVLYLLQQIVIHSFKASDTMPSPSLPYCTRNRDTCPRNSPCMQIFARASLHDSALRSALPCWCATMLRHFCAGGCWQC